jgi:hypothetical protein
MVRVANDDHRPEWKSDSFFRRYANKSTAEKKGM